jgi:biotin operon repressor
MKKYFTFSSWLDLLQKLGQEKQKILSAGTLERASGLGRAAALKAIQRLSRRGYLIKLYKQTYANRFSPPALEEVAMLYGKPCYISFESALEDQGIMSQAPLVLTCATTRKIKNLNTPLGEIVFHHLQPRLFNNFINDRGVLRATPEKALLDYLYIELNNKQEAPALDEFNLAGLNKKKLKKIAGLFPGSVRQIIKARLAAAKIK